MSADLGSKIDTDMGMSLGIKRVEQSFTVQGFCHNPPRCVDAVHHNVTKSETLVPPPPNYNIIYPVDASVRSVKISPVNKILLSAQPSKVLVNIYLYFHLLIQYLSALITIQIYIHIWR